MRARRQAVLLLLPGLAVLAGLFLLPQALMLAASPWQRSPYGGLVRDWTLANYARAVDPLYVWILVRSFSLAFFTTLLCLVVGWPVAYWLGLRVSPRFKNALLVLVILPFWTSFLVRMYAWIVLLRSEGVVNLALATVGLPRAELLYNDTAVLLGQLYGELPFMIIIFNELRIT